MSVLWEKLAGNTDRFAFKLAFSRDPDDGAFAAPEMAASWGAFQIWVDGQNLCAHQEEGEIVESVHWYLLPMLEWLIENWDPLLHEEKFPLARQAEGAWASLRETQFPPAALKDDTASDWEKRWQAWWRRHGILSCREGGLFPDICIRRKRDEIEMSWGRSPLPGSHGSFVFLVPSGVYHLEPEEVADPMYDVLGDALKHLSRQFPKNRRIKAACRGFSKIETSLKTERRLAWLAGLGTGPSQTRGWRKLVEWIRERPVAAANSVLEADSSNRVILGSCHAALMFGSLSPRIKSQDVITLAEKMVGLYSPSGDSSTLAELMAIDLPMGVSEKPFEHGYRLAEAVLEELGLPEDGKENICMSSVCERLKIRCEHVNLVDANVRGVAIAGPRTRPGILVNDSYPYHTNPEAVRFTKAHELCHLIFDRTRGKKLALASGPWAPVGVEQRAKAFAAMFLMPTKLVLRVASGLDLSALEGLGKVAAKLKASKSATLEHIFNIGLIDEIERDQMRAKLGHTDPEGV